MNDENIEIKSGLTEFISKKFYICDIDNIDDMTEFSKEYVEECEDRKPTILIVGHSGQGKKELITSLLIKHPDIKIITKDDFFEDPHDDIFQNMELVIKKYEWPIDNFNFYKEKKEPIHKRYGHKSKKDIYRSIKK